MLIAMFSALTGLHDDYNCWFDGIWLFAVCFVGSIFTFLICGRNSEKGEVSQTRRQSQRRSSTVNELKIVTRTSTPTSKTKPETDEEIERQRKTRYMTLNDIENELSLRHADMAHADILKSKGIKIVEKKEIYEKLESKENLGGNQPKGLQEDSYIRRLVDNAMKPEKEQNMPTVKRPVRYPEQPQYEYLWQLYGATSRGEEFADVQAERNTRAKEWQNKMAAMTDGKDVEVEKGGAAPEDPRRESATRKGAEKIDKDAKDEKLKKRDRLQSILTNAAGKDVKYDKKVAFKASPQNVIANTGKLPGTKRQLPPVEVGTNCGMSMTEGATQKNEIVDPPFDQRRYSNLNPNVKVAEPKCKRKDTTIYQSLFVATKGKNTT